MSLLCDCLIIFDPAHRQNEDDIIKVSKTEAKKTKAKKTKVPAKKKAATGTGAAKKKTSAKGKKDVAATTAAKKMAKTQAASKVKKANLLASRRGMAPKMDASTIQKTIKKEAEKLAKKMIAANSSKSKGGVAGGRGKNKSVKIQFKTADLKRGTDKNTVRQLEGMLRKSPKPKNGRGGSAGKGSGGGRKIILR